MLKKVPPFFARLVALCLCLAFLTINAFAQSEATTGNIEGRVLDPNGAVVPNATVTAKNKDTGFERSATTDGEGNYRIILLPPGKYTVSARGAGRGARSSRSASPPRSVAPAVPSSTPSPNPARTPSAADSSSIFGTSL